MSKAKPKLYGAEWCPKTSGIRNYLQSQWVDFEYLDVENDEEAAEELKAMYEGKLKFPTLVFGDQKMKNPSIGDIRLHIKDMES